MPHAWGIKCGKMKTPMEVWNDEEHLSKGLNKILSGTFFKFIWPKTIKKAPTIRVIINVIVEDKYIFSIFPY